MEVAFNDEKGPLSNSIDRQAAPTSGPLETLRKAGHANEIPSNLCIC